MTTTDAEPPPVAPPPAGRVDRLEEEVADLRRAVTDLAEQVRALQDQAGA